MISAIVAQANNRIIGQSNELPWYLPADLKHFKDITMNHAVIMGRKTFDSILARLGKPLPDRLNIVITRNESFRAEGAMTAHSLKEALQKAADREVFIIGGAQIYKQALPHLNRIYLTQIDANIKGDTYFPILDNNWNEVSRETHLNDEKNKYSYAFIILDKTG